MLMGPTDFTKESGKRLSLHGGYSVLSMLHIFPKAAGPDLCGLHSTLVLLRKE
jgi:hypothetical protein